MKLNNFVSHMYYEIGRRRQLFIIIEQFREKRSKENRKSSIFN